MRNWNRFRFLGAKFGALKANAVKAEEGAEKKLKKQ
jgi:hypothetical protein